MRDPLNEVFNLREEFSSDDDRYDMAEVPANPQQLDGPPVDHKDEDDIEVEKKIDEVYDAAMDAFKAQQGYLEVIEPRYAARNAEVASAYLNIALGAANSRAKVKTDRKRANQAYVPYANGGKTTNNILVADRNEILKMINIDGVAKRIG